VLHRITVYVETDDQETIERLSEAFEVAVCPHPAGETHTCPNRWMIIAAEVPDDELRELGDLDAFLNA
jgi:hypothetical protein